MPEPLVFITSLNEDLFNTYGKKMLESWVRFSSMDTVLVVCFEDQDNQYMKDFDSGNIIQLSIWSDDMRLFFDKYEQLAELNGFQFKGKSKEEWKSVTATYDHRFDAIRFSFKIFAITKCLDAGLIGNRFAWLDADVCCRKPFSAENLENAFPNADEMATYLGRRSHPAPIAYTECGFVAYNRAHTATADFLQAFKDFYVYGNFLLLKEWHDCLIFDYLRLDFEKQGFKFRNLVADYPDLEDPFTQSELSNYFDHLKSPDRKRAQSSFGNPAPNSTP